MYVKPSTYGQHYLNEIHAYFFLIATFNRTMFFKNNVSVTYNNILIVSYVKFTLSICLITSCTTYPHPWRWCSRNHCILRCSWLRHHTLLDKSDCIWWGSKYFCEKRQSHIQKNLDNTKWYTATDWLNPCPLCTPLRRPRLWGWSFCGCVSEGPLVGLPYHKSLHWQILESNNQRK